MLEKLFKITIKHTFNFSQTKYRKGVSMQS